MASSVMHHYGMSHDELLRLPMNTFWELARNIGRHKAQDDLRMFALLQNCLAGNPQQYINQLKSELSAPADVEDDDDLRVDKAAFARFAMLSRGA